jgi:hypothetical protein
MQAAIAPPFAIFVAGGTCCDRRSEPERNLPPRYGGCENVGTGRIWLISVVCELAHTHRPIPELFVKQGAAFWESNQNWRVDPD